MVKCVVVLFLLGISSAYAQTTEQSSKIEGYGVLDANGEQSSKIEGYGVLDTNGLQSSKITGYAVLGVGPQLSKLEGYAVLDSVVPFGSLGLSKLDSYAILFPFPPPPPFSPPAACASPTIDGVQKGQQSTGVAPSPFLLTTTKANDIIFLHIATGVFMPGVTPPPVTSVSDSYGLVWTRRGSRLTFTVPDETWNVASVDEFWAYSPTPLTADDIAWTYGAGPVFFVLGVAFGVPGVSSTLAPFDTNVSLPASSSNVSPGFSQPQVTMSTDNAQDLLFTSCTSQAAAGLCSQIAAAGWTTIEGAGFTGVDADLQTELYYKRVSSTLTAATINIDGATTHDWVAIADAFAGGGGGAGCNVRPQVWIAQ